MNINLPLKSDPEVSEVFNKYPDFVQGKMRYLRDLVLQVANDLEQVSSLHETLKWGEPSYITKQGSTLRMDWKSKNPDQYAFYFSCSTKLVETFRLFHGPVFNYEGKRAIVFTLDQELPVEEIKSCIRVALTYHKVKNLKYLGMGKD